MTTIVTAHQPCYLPWLGFFHKASLADVFVSLDNVQYEKNSFINRNKIKTPQGAIWLTVPVLTKGHLNKKLIDMEINNNVNWRKKHLKSLQVSYKKAPYFDSYSDFFNELYKRDWKYIVELNEYIIKFLFNELNINVDFIKGTDLNLKGKKSELILDLCEKTNADVFIFGALGKKYADVDLFISKNIHVYFQDYKHPTYPQLWGPFLSNLSVVDLLLNVGPEKATRIIISDNITKDDIIKSIKR